VIEKLRGLRANQGGRACGDGGSRDAGLLGFPEEHWRRIRTNNSLERILREIRRRTRVVWRIPRRQSALNLAAGRLRHIAGAAWPTKRYLNTELLKDQQMRAANHRVSQCRASLSPNHVQKTLDTTD
jgi:transposase-like protein